jgi:hypothetical protein
MNIDTTGFIQIVRVVTSKARIHCDLIATPHRSPPVINADRLLCGVNLGSPEVLFRLGWGDGKRDLSVAPGAPGPFNIIELTEAGTASVASQERGRLTA